MDFALKAVELALSRGMAVTITKDGSVVMGTSATLTPTGAPQYVSDTVEDLPRGSVVKQVRAKFKKMGTTGIVIAHYADTVRQAFNKQGWGVSLKATDKPNEYFCIRIPITRRKRSV